jgi:hypothetical protein
VPLIMALRLDPVRLLIADDVGVGKTIEAGMIARELLDRGIVRRLCVPCPAHLCDQWERELRQKFAIDTAVVRPSSVARLERELPRQDLSIYEHYPHLIASIDFVKAERHRGPFLRTAPDLVIVDEAHGAARPRGDRERGQHQRHELIHALATDRERHLLLVTATPHSGIEESFRSLLGLLDRTFEQPPPGSVAADRRRLLPHVIQRRRKDVERWLGAETPFPERVAEETRYDLGRDYLALYRDVLEYCRETVEAGAGLRAAQQRVRYWAAIALLRCLLSSPGSAQAVLAARAQRLAAEGESSEEEKDSAYRPQVTDVLDDEEADDYMPTARSKTPRPPGPTPSAAASPSSCAAPGRWTAPARIANWRRSPAPSIRCSRTAFGRWCFAGSSPRRTTSPRTSPNSSADRSTVLRCAR